MDTPVLTLKIQTPRAAAKSTRRRRIRVGVIVTAFTAAVIAPSPMAAWGIGSHHHHEQVVVKHRPLLTGSTDGAR